MTQKLPYLLFLAAFLSLTSARAQSCDPWIIQAYGELFGRKPTAAECNISNYNNGSWNNYDQLKGYIKAYNNVSTTSAAAKAEAYGNCGKSGYNGLCSIAEFTNNDFPVRKTTCGQAAAVTALWHVGLSSAYGAPKKLVKSFYDYAPPKVTVAGLLPFANSFGSDWRQINYGLDGYANQGIRYSWLKGIPALKAELKKKWPCLIMLDTGTLPQFNYGWVTGHWVVAYGYDANYLYVTNFPDNRMTWAELTKAWGGDWKEGHLAKLHGTAEMFAVVWKQ